MRGLFFLFILTFIAIRPSVRAYATDSVSVQATDSTINSNHCEQQDIFDVLFPKKKPTAQLPTKRKVSAIIIPIIGYSPATGFQFGAGSSLSWPMGHNPLTKLSAGSAQLTWTTERQLIFQIRSNMYFSRNKWFLQSDWRWYLFQNPTYGLGTGPQDNIAPLQDIPDISDTTTNIEKNGGKFPMKYKWIKFHNILFREVLSHFYLGLGYHLDHYYDIKDKLLNLTDENVTITPHYSYSMKHGFSPAEYTASGISMSFAYDSRDNIINAYSGIYINVNYLMNFKSLGSTQNGSRLWTEFRTYVGLSSRNPRHLLAFWLFGNYTITGSMPYLNLMSNGFDQMNSSGRGYTQGRWRGDDFAYGEMEYRFPISKCSGIVGGVLFANFISASNHDMNVPLFQYLQPGCGFGLRIMIGKTDRTNLLIDFGLGAQSMGMYLQAQEIF